MRQEERAKGTKGEKEGGRRVEERRKIDLRMGSMNKERKLRQSRNSSKGIKGCRGQCFRFNKPLGVRRTIYVPRFRSSPCSH